MKWSSLERVSSVKVYIILALLVAAVFANSMQNSFVWDHYPLIVDNPKIALSIRDIPSVFTEPQWKFGYFSRYQQNYYRPIVHMVFALNYKIWGLNPQGFHLTDILLHIMSVIFLYRVGLLLFDNDKLISLIAASIFAVHPVNNKSVGSAAQGEVILGFFIILSLYFFLREKRYLSLFTFSLALLSKEAAVVFPFALVILAVHKRGLKKGAIEILPYMVLVGTYFILRAIIMDTVFGGNVAQPLLTRAFTMAAATLDYIRLFIIPYPLRPYYPAKWYSSILEPKVMFAVFVLISIVFLTLKIRKDKIMLFLLIFPFFMLAPVIWRVNTFPCGDFDSASIAEHYLYIPAMPLSLFISASAVRLFRNRARKYLMIVWLLVTGIFISLTISAATVWKNDVILFEDIVKYSPNTIFGHNNLGVAYEKQGRWNDAIQEYLIALRLNPNNIKPINNLGNIYLKMGFIDNAITYYRAALRLDPGFAAIHNNLGVAYKQKGMRKEAIQEFQTALKLQPDIMQARKNLESLQR